ncbi:MAG: DUF1559 domain-containing protein [Thermoguttaceae bacterium]|nr:DUF1559 domain-containing protein [Thermoguttaceae bacterium]
MKRNGFTLVELLIVISIIAVLVGLLLPAVYGARESARRLTCTNHIRQLASGCLNHETAHGFFPTGGWSHMYVGDPNAGVGKHQPGGWVFNVLPYIDLTAIHDKGLGKKGTELRNALTEMVQTPIAIMNCPTRRKADIANNVIQISKNNINKPDYYSRTDYAGNAGSYGKNTYGGFPNTCNPDYNPDVVRAHERSNPKWPENIDVSGRQPNHRQKNNGMFYTTTEITRNEVTDGLSNTYFIGEKFVDAKAYNGLAECRGDNDTMFVGHDPDTIRWCYGQTEKDYDNPNNSDSLKGLEDLKIETGAKAYTNSNYYMPPMHDINNVPGGFPWQNYFWRYGSAHSSSLNMAFGDASVHRVHYGIDGQIHALLGSRKDGQMIPDTKELK